MGFQILCPIFKKKHNTTQTDKNTKLFFFLVISNKLISNLLHKQAREIQRNKSDGKTGQRCAAKISNINSQATVKMMIPNIRTDAPQQSQNPCGLLGFGASGHRMSLIQSDSCGASPAGDPVLSRGTDPRPLGAPGGRPRVP